MIPPRNAIPADIDAFSGYRILTAARMMPSATSASV